MCCVLLWYLAPECRERRRPVGPAPCGLQNPYVIEIQKRSSVVPYPVLSRDKATPANDAGRPPPLVAF